jgi:hypothetical protein
MMSLLLPCATVEVSLIAGWCWIGATPRGEPQMPAMMLPYGARVCARGGWRCSGRAAALHGSPSGPPINAQRAARFDHYHARNCLPPQNLRREIQ